MADENPYQDPNEYAEWAKYGLGRTENPAVFSHVWRALTDKGGPLFVMAATPPGRAASGFLRRGAPELDALRRKLTESAGSTALWGHPLPPSMIDKTVNMIRAVINSKLGSYGRVASRGPKTRGMPEGASGAETALSRDDLTQEGLTAALEAAEKYGPVWPTLQTKGGRQVPLQQAMRGDILDALRKYVTANVETNPVGTYAGQVRSLLRKIDADYEKKLGPGRILTDEAAHRELARRGYSVDIHDLPRLRAGLGFTSERLTEGAAEAATSFGAQAADPYLVAISRLPSRRRLIVELLTGLGDTPGVGITEKQVAQRLGISQQAISTQLMKARKQLLAEYQKLRQEGLDPTAEAEEEVQRVFRWLGRATPRRDALKEMEPE